MAFDIRMPDDVVVEKELSAVDLPVHKGAILLMREEDGGPSLSVYDLLHEITDQRVKAPSRISEDGVQSQVAHEHIVRVAEHYIVRCGGIK